MKLESDVVKVVVDIGLDVVELESDVAKVKRVAVELGIDVMELRLHVVELGLDVG